MFKRLKQIAGYTLVELVVVIAIIGALTAALIAGSTQTGKNERFSGELRNLSNQLREAQTKGYSIATGQCQTSDCHWRGNVIEYSASADTVSFSLLEGTDLSPASTNINQKRGITAKISQQTRDLAPIGLDITRIEYGASSSIPTASIAFLAPDGRSYGRSSLADNTNFGPNAQPYAEDVQITIYLRDTANNLDGQVIFNTSSGRIETKVGS